MKLSNWINIQEKWPLPGQRCQFYSIHLGFGIGKFRFGKYSLPWTFKVEKLYNEQLHSEFADKYVTHWRPVSDAPLDLP